MRNGGKREHALDIGLGDGRQVTQKQRGNRQDHKHLLPVNGQRQHTLDQQAQGDGKGRQLGRAANHQGDGSGRALVHIRDPHVKRHHAQLEGQTGHDKHQAKNQHLVAHLA